MHKHVQTPYESAHGKLVQHALSKIASPLSRVYGHVGALAGKATTGDLQRFVAERALSKFVGSVPAKLLVGPLMNKVGSLAKPRIPAEAKNQAKQSFAESSTYVASRSPTVAVLHLNGSKLKASST